MYEIERKFLTDWSVDKILDYYREPKDRWTIQEVAIEQLYFRDTGSWAMRVRQKTWNFAHEYILTIKKPVSETKNIEIEAPIPQEEYEEIIRLESKNLITKFRYEIMEITPATDWLAALDSPIWFIDIFENPEFGGLVMLEVEMAREDYPLELPPFVGREVTSEPRYRNYNLFNQINPNRRPIDDREAGS